MHPNNEDLLKLLHRFEEIQSQFVDGYAELTALRDQVKTNTYSMEELINRIYIVRQCSKYLDDLRKEMDGVSNLMEKLCCALWTIKYANDPLKAESIHAQFATGTPKIWMRSKLPKIREDPDRYFELLAYFGVSQKHAAMEVVKINWPRFGDFLTDAAENGEPLPHGIKPDETYCVYSVNVLARRDLDSILDELDGVEDKEKMEEILLKKE